jgi:hypothetical protein
MLCISHIKTELGLNLNVVCAMAVMLLSANMFYHIGMGAKDRDERLARVGNEAMSFSWYVTLVVILLSLALTGVLDIGLTTGQIMGIGLIAMISTMIGHNEIMIRRGGDRLSMGMVKARTISVALGGLLLIGCGVLMIIGDTLGDILWLEIMIGMGLFMGGMGEYIGLKKPLKDERAARIGTLAMTYSWYTVLLWVATIAMIFGFGGGYKVTMAQAVGTTLIVMVMSIFGFNWFLGRKGDVE